MELSAISQELKSFLEPVKQLAQEAGKKILPFYKSKLAVEYKMDNSPATEADRVAEHLILYGLTALSHYPIISEEHMAAGHEPFVEQGEAFWLVDPLDGTKEFIKGSPEFTVNIALVYNHKPVLGVIYAPVLDELFSGIVTHEPSVAAGYGGAVTLITSRSCKDVALPQDVTIKHHVECGSSLKFGRLTQGVATHYPRPGRTMEWDTAAGHAILKAHGGNVFDAQGKELSYQKPNYENPSFLAVRYD